MPKPLERLNSSHVGAALAAVTGSAGTRHRVLATLRAALNAAVKKHKEDAWVDEPEGGGAPG